MNRKVLILILAFTATVAQAQVKEPVKWSFSVKKLDARIYEVHMTATIAAGWHVYSQSTPDGGPVPTSVSFTKNPLLQMQGNIQELGNLEQHNEPLFGVDVKQYSNRVDFVQKLQLKATAKTAVTGAIEFMVCNDKECLPPTRQKFSADLK